MPIVRLFPNHRSLERELYETAKIFPIMHLIAMRRSLYERHRWLATSFYKAFVESKRLARVRMRYGGSLSTMLPWLLAEIGDILAHHAEPDRVGRRILAWRRVLGEAAKARPGMARVPGRCPACDRARTLSRRDDGYVRCGACGQHLSPDEYDDLAAGKASRGAG